MPTKKLEPFNALADLAAGTPPHAEWRQFCDDRRIADIPPVDARVKAAAPSQGVSFFGLPS